MLEPYFHYTGECSILSLPGSTQYYNILLFRGKRNSASLVMACVQLDCRCNYMPCERFSASRSTEVSQHQDMDGRHIGRLFTTGVELHCWFAEAPGITGHAIWNYKVTRLNLLLDFCLCILKSCNIISNLVWKILITLASL